MQLEKEREKKLIAKRLRVSVSTLYRYLEYTWIRPIRRFNKILVN